MAKYQGHKNKAHWNVALWLANDEGLYNTVKRTLRLSPNKDVAAKRLFDELPEKTPDGYKYSVSSIRAALVGM